MFINRIKQILYLRYLKKYSKIIIRLVIISILAWFLMFNIVFYFLKSKIEPDYNLESIDEVNSFLNKVQRNQYNINCQSIIEWDENEIRNAKKILYKLKSEENITKIDLIPDFNYVFDKSMCNLFKQLRGYDSYKIHQFEFKFPLAFSILTYNNVEQFERLLNAIYR